MAAGQNGRRAAGRWAGPAVTLLLQGVLLTGGCESPASRPLPATQVDRLAAAYPAAESGRLVILADFEDPRQMELFHVVSVSRHARCAPDAARGRNETGTGCLLFSTGSPNDTLVISNQYAANWHLKRDWRDYDLLLMSVYAPDGGLVLEVSIQGGRPQEAKAMRTPVPLVGGWNVIRLDVAEIGERLPLDDVREIWLSLTGHRKPVELVLDDLFLTRSRADLFGDSQNRNSGLYVQRIGRRFRVGSGGAGADFELTFANGQIVEWYNRRADPYRTRNLVRGTALGPTPRVAVEHAGGSPVAAHTRIIEANAVRALVSCEWRFPAGSGPMKENQRQRRESTWRWFYAVYPTGQVYVRVERTGSGSASAPSSVDEAGREATVLTVSLADDGDEWQTRVETAPNDASAEPPVQFATARNRSAGANLLFAPYQPDGVVELSWRGDLGDEAMPAARAPSGTVNLEARLQTPAGRSRTWHFHLFLGMPDEFSDQEAAARAHAYANPPALGPLGRSSAQSAAASGRSSADLFNPGTGCYMMGGDGASARAVLDGGLRPLYSPCFEVAGKSGRATWVYLDHVLFDAVAREAPDRLVFQIPGVMRREVLVEVLRGS